MSKKYTFTVDEKTYIDIRSLDLKKDSAADVIRHALRWYKYTKHKLSQGYKPVFERGDDRIIINTEET